ncbi:MAG TPA: galactokinase family protein [Gemmatimonadaceae bacterium]|nr:galactokinase family protein [Gemmatimonadaceae bacterium]
MSEFWVPGRIEVLGKHTDYAGGRSLVCAIDRGFSVRCTRRADAEIHVIDTKRNETFTTSMSPAATAPAGSWGSYVAAVARRLSRDFPRATHGADIALSSTLPADAGLSSSSALVVSIALSLIDANDLETSDDYKRAFPVRTDLAGYLGAVENGRPFGSFAGDAGVGTFGGSEDHTAILCCRQGMLGQYSYAPVRHETDVAIDPSLTFVIGVSGVIAKKTGDALGDYNRLSLGTSVLLDVWNRGAHRADETLAAALHSNTGAAPQLRALVGDASHQDFSATELVKRLDQFVEESHSLVPAAAKAFRDNDLAALGTIVDRSHELAVTHLGNQVPETITLQQSARALGAHAASAFGAGFGGSVWALIEAQRAGDFAQRWSAEYRRQHPSRTNASFFSAKPGAPARRV